MNHKCDVCGSPLTCICMSCRGRSRSRKKINATRQNIAKAQQLRWPKTKRKKETEEKP